MTFYNRHREYEKARRIEWKDKTLDYAPELVMQILLAREALKPDGPFPPQSDHVQCVIGREVVAINRADVEELMFLILQASVRVMKVINGVQDSQGAKT